MTTTAFKTHLDRRGFIAACSGAGITSALLPGVLFALAAQGQDKAPDGSPSTLRPITAEMIDQAAALAGVGPFPPDQVKLMLDGLNDQRTAITGIRALKLSNSIPPAFVFHPLAPDTGNHDPNTEAWHQMPRFVRTLDSPPYKPTGNEPKAPARIEDLAFATVSQLGELLAWRKITSLALTQMFLARLKRYDPKLHFVITLTEDRALAQARKADEEIAAGLYRGPLHGIPWGAKDLLAVKDHPTTWGAGGFEHQSFSEDATVVQRLDAAGAVLVAKFSLGALAMGDKWFGGRTRNPWNPTLGSSGSSAGSASAVAAGCVPFAIGSETLGSISSPSTRCGCTGLRPTFGLVPRTGAMALSWTMDKLGPIARSVDDCLTVLAIIHGPDGHDTSVPQQSADWSPSTPDWKSLRIGYLKSEFDLPEPLKLEEAKPSKSPDSPETPSESQEARARAARNDAARDARVRTDYDRRFLLTTLEKLRALGVNLIPVELPALPYDAMVPLLTAEAAAAFDDLTLSGRDRLLTEQGPEDWPNAFRTARFYPAVDYIQANRARTLAVRQMSALFEKVDIIVTPSTDRQLICTNLTGHPALILPNGFRGPDAPAPPAIDDGDHDDIGGPGTPVSLTFLAAHFHEAKLAAFAAAYQQATGFHLHHPTLD
jgi:Asp-tRNA(Asn)/Glu-tRNA(Gln) amidotransferase A subunit family amidase